MRLIAVAAGWVGGLGGVAVFIVLVAVVLANRHARSWRAGIFVERDYRPGEGKNRPPESPESPETGPDDP